MGRQGSGKSTFTKQLAEKLGIEAIHLDNLYHKNGWERVTKAEWHEIQKKFLKKKEWVIDGTYLSSIEPRLRLADTVIFLDFPAYVSVSRALRRFWHYKGGTRPDVSSGMQEKITWRFIRKITTFSRKRVIDTIKENPEVKMIVLKNAKDVENFLNNV